MSNSGVSFSKQPPTKFPKPDPKPRVVTVYDNEHITPPKQFVLNHMFKNYDQFKLKVSDQMNVKPLKGIYNSQGKAIAKLEEIQDAEILVAVKHAGRPLDKSFFEKKL